MKIRLKDFEQYTRNAPAYKDGLIFVQSGIEKEDSTCMMMWLRRLCQSKDGLSYMLVTSSHESKGAIEKKIVHTGKVGRPRTVVKGEKAENHCHGLIVNENENISIEDVRKEIGTYCRKRRKKRPNLKRQKIQDLQGMQIVKYMSRQADNEYKYGTFDFEYFKDIRFCDYSQKDNYVNISDP